MELNYNNNNPDEISQYYQPIHPLSILSIIISFLFSIVVLIVAVIGIVTNKLSTHSELLLFGCASLLLSYITLRLTRYNTTRKGLTTAKYAWRMSIVSCLGYLTYLGAIDYAIRHEATREAKLWIENATSGKLENINRAFIKTLPPGRRQNTSPLSNEEQLLAEFGDEFYTFTQVDLVRIGRRNPGQCRIVVKGLKNWSQKSSNVECIIYADIECPEGLFPIELQLRGEGSSSSASSDSTTSRQWLVSLSPQGYVRRGQERLTAYGRLISNIEGSGAAIAKLIIDTTNMGPTVLPSLYNDYVSNSHSINDGTEADSILRTHILSGSCITLHDFNNNFWSYLRNQAFTLPNNKAPSANQIDQFIYIIHNSNLSIPGSRIPKNDIIDGHLLTIVDDDTIRLYVPFELSIIRNDGFSDGVGRGKMLLVCRDADVLQQLKSLRESLNYDDPKPNINNTQSYSWQLVRFESNLKPVKIQGQNDLLPSPTIR